MENASKALIMAGGVLVGLLVISIGVALYMNFSNSSKSLTSNWDSAELTKYNSSFFVYVSREDISAQELMSLVSLSQQREGDIKIIINDIDATNWNTSEINTFLSLNILTTEKDASGKTVKKNTFTYVSDSIKYDRAGRICEMKFKKNP